MLYLKKTIVQIPNYFEKVDRTSTDIYELPNPREYNMVAINADS